MLISASRRTDIPAFFMPWFMGRLDAGWCEVANPFRPSQVTRVDLTPAAVTAVVFWTRDPRPLQPYLRALDENGYRYVALVTLNGYAQPLESYVPVHTEAVRAFQNLADHVGPDRVVWRYDPILLTRRYDAAFHRRVFAQTAKALSGSTRRVIISLADFYSKTERHLQRYEQETGDVCCRAPLEAPGTATLLRDLAASASNCGMTMQSCAEPKLPPGTGIEPGACIDAAWLNRGLGLSIPDKRHTGQRRDCQCCRSIDIGVNNTCRHGCLYCYATSNHDKAARLPAPSPAWPALAPR